MRPVFPESLLATPDLPKATFWELLVQEFTHATCSFCPQTTTSEYLWVQWRSQGGHGCMPPPSFLEIFSEYTIFAVLNFWCIFSVEYSACLWRICPILPPGLCARPPFAPPRSKFLATPLYGYTFYHYYFLQMFICSNIAWENVHVLRGAIFCCMWRTHSDIHKAMRYKARHSKATPKVCLSLDFISGHMNNYKVVYFLLQKIFGQWLKEITYFAAWPRLSAQGQKFWS